MNFQPLGNRVLVQIPEEKTKTDSGIFLPDSSTKEVPTQAKVVAISSDIKEVNVEDTVVYAKYAGTELNIDGIDYLVLEDKDIMGVLK
jgi:chaperonin GroES